MYRYEELKPGLFGDEGQRRFLTVRDFVDKTLAAAGAIRMQEAISAARGGDSWQRIACVDRLVELGELREMSQDGVAGQHRVFVRKER